MTLGRAVYTRFLILPPLFSLNPSQAVASVTPWSCSSSRGPTLWNVMVNPSSSSYSKACCFSSQVRCDQARHPRHPQHLSFSQSLIQGMVAFAEHPELATPHLLWLPWWYTTSIFAWVTVTASGVVPLFSVLRSPLASVCSKGSSQNEPAKTQVRPVPSDPTPISPSVKVTALAMADRSSTSDLISWASSLGSFYSSHSGLPDVSRTYSLESSPPSHLCSRKPTLTISFTFLYFSYTCHFLTRYLFVMFIIYLSQWSLIYPKVCVH